MKTALAMLAAVCLSVCGVAGCSPTRPNAFADPAVCCNLPHELASAQTPDPTALAWNIPSVRTVLDPDAPPRFISLAECLALALENGRTQTNIRVLAYNPAEAATAIEQALSRFDVQWQTGMTWNKVEEPNVVPDPVDLFRAAQMGIPPVNKADTAQFQSQMLKPLPTGGVAGITFTVPYTLNNARFTNTQLTQPAYTPSLQFSFEQPLLRGFGVEANEVRASHPGSLLSPFTLSGSGVGILVARVNFDQARAQFDQQVQDLLLAVEQAYWDLYGSYWILYVRDEALKISLRTWNRGKQLFEAKQMTVQDLAQLEAQYQANRLQRLAALGQGAGRAGVLRAERVLRQTIGLPPEDGTRLVPSDRPTDALYHPDWGTARDEALALRPELLQARQQVKLAELRVQQGRDALLPDLRFFSTYNYNGIGTRLDGPSSANAFESLASNRYHDWTLGLQMQVALGAREANAQARNALLQLGQSHAALRDGERAVIFGLQDSYRQLVEAAEALRMQRALIATAQRQLEARVKEFQLGQGIVFNLLNAQQTWFGAQEQYQTAICFYNVALANWQRQKGTILQYDNVTIAEGAVPPFAAERASEHIHERQHALVLRERPAGSEQSSDLLPVKITEPPSLPEFMAHDPGGFEPLGEALPDR